VAEAVEEARRRAERARLTGVFRYQLIQDVTGPPLAAGQGGALVRELAGREHDGPAGQKIRVSEQTIRRWVRDWRSGGFEALVPAPARVSARTPAEVLELAVALKKENPARTAAQVTRILRAQAGWAPSDRTVQRHFERLELNRPAAAAAPAAAVFGRFEAARPNEIWTGDALHGPVIAGRKTYLFAFIDDHSRAVMAARFGFSEDTVRLAAALRPALASRGVPESALVDNGSAFVDSWLLRACAVLGIRLIHSTPRRPPLTGQSLDRLPVIPPHVNRESDRPGAWCRPACRLDRGGADRATGVPCLMLNRCGCREAGNGGGSRAGGGPPTGSCATTTSVTWPTAAIRRPASAATRSTCCTSPAGSPGRTLAWTRWTPMRCCATWRRAGPSAALASTTT